MDSGGRYKVAFFAPYLERVGVENLILNLADELSRSGLVVDLLRAHHEWSHLNKDCSNIRVVNLGTRRILPTLPLTLPFRLRVSMLALTSMVGLVAYLRRERPDVLIAGLLTVVAIGAKVIACVPSRVIITASGFPRPTRVRQLLWRLTFPKATAIVAESQGIADQVASIARVPRESIRVIYSPIPIDQITESSVPPPSHPWFRLGEPPVILGVGRLTRQKDFDCLIRAFALVKQKMPAKLVILGDGPQRPHLENLARELKVSQDVSLPGYVERALYLSYLLRSRLFVLSSRWEGLVRVLMEALSLGKPVIATDCPGGPREILLDGTVGHLVPIGNPKILAEAIIGYLSHPDLAMRIAELGKQSVSRFSPQRCAQQYLELFAKI